ncbi:hypothetical protein [Mycobacterium sp.]|uniref:hypothetical protein n=1 Tax=Mycobacterium sp. TaxID=1785 RepID=UPI0031CE7BD9
MMPVTHQWLAVAALTGAAAGPHLIPATAHAELHNLTYIARIDGVAPGGTATFVIHDDETNTASLSSSPDNTFEADTVLSDPASAGMQVAITWPYSANVHCEIDVDDNVATQVDQFVRPAPGGTDPMNGVLACGAPLPAT